MNRRSRILSIVLLAQIILLSCEQLSLESHWTNQPIVIDGKDAEWQSIPLHRFESWDISLGVCNDGGYLYMLFYFENPMLMMAAGTRGIVLEFINSNSREEMFKLQYTGIDTLGSASEPEDSFWLCLNPDQRKQFMNQQAVMKNRITVTVNRNSVRIPPDGTQGVSAARVYHRTFCGYEWCIPIQKNENRPYALGVDLGDSVNVRIRLGEQESDRASDKMVPTGAMAGGSPMGGPGGSFSRGPAMKDGEVSIGIVLAENK
jgi:hypothetical protein